MAGTRLWVQAVALIEILIVGLSAYYHGLCRGGAPQDTPMDALCVPFFQRQGISSLSLNDAEIVPLSLAPLKMAVASPSEQQRWEEAWTALKTAGDSESIQVSMLDETTIRRACASPDDDSNDGLLQEYVILVCPPSSTASREYLASMEVSKRWGTAFVTPSKDAAIDQLAEALFRPTHITDMTTRLRPHVHIHVLMEDGVQWRHISAAVDDWLESSTVEHWPLWCFQRPSDIVTTILTNNDDMLITQAKKRPKSDNTTSYLVSTLQVQAWLEDHIPEESSSTLLQVVLYFSKGGGLEIARKTSKGALETTTAISMGPYFLSILRPSDVMSFRHVTHLLQRQCAGIDHSSIKMDGALSLYSIQLHMRRLLRSLHEQARKEVSTTKQFLLHSFWTVPVTEKVARHLKEAVGLINEATKMANNTDDYLGAVDLLEESIAKSRSLRSDPTLMEGVQFPVDQYLAIFAPLLFPLLLPFLAGLIRETKRYKTLSKAKTTEEA